MQLPFEDWITRAVVQSSGSYSASVQRGWKMIWRMGAMMSLVALSIYIVVLMALGWYIKPIQRNVIIVLILNYD